ncbi:MAG: hypothetical protein IJA10_01070 [Lachnospiraceae bacterium]|nr:hypothetical protein [Lachnospiraceae bacterium]
MSILKHKKRFLTVAAAFSLGCVLLSNNGVRAETGFQTNPDGTRFYQKVDGTIATGWAQINNDWYYFDPVTGIQVTGWKFINDNWYYMDPGNEGKMKTGWFNESGAFWYYLSDGQYGPEGAMLTGTYYIEEQELTFKPNGQLFIQQGWYTMNGNELYFYDSNTAAKAYEKIDGAYVNGYGGKRISAMAKGIDISRYQNQTKAIDWTQVVEDDIEFVMVGPNYIYNPKHLQYFHKNLKGATDSGLDVGVYLYSYATTPKEAQDEAFALLEQIKGYPINFPVAYDLEDACQKKLTKQERTDLVKAFCEVIRQAGYQPALYASKTWLTTMVDMSQLSQYDIWVAQYNHRTTYGGSYTMWQCSSTAQVDGIQGNVDMNMLYKDYSASLTKRYAANDGFVKGITGEVFYLVNNKRLTGWQEIGGAKYYFQTGGVMHTGLLEYEGNSYYFSEDGKMVADSFVTIDGKTYYFSPSGAMSIGLHMGWNEIEDVWYYVEYTGNAKGWRYINGKWYFFDSEGKMQTGWELIKDKWYYLDAVNGDMKTGWIRPGSYTWYYMDPVNGDMKTGWTEVKGKKYFLDLTSGAMKTNWQLLEDKWYYFDAINGDMKTGWVRPGSTIWYYMNLENGTMETGWIFDGKNYYYLDSEGRMQCNTTVEGYELNAFGACTNPDTGLEEIVNETVKDAEKEIKEEETKTKETTTEEVKEDNTEVTIEQSIEVNMEGATENTLISE